MFDIQHDSQVPIHEQILAQIMTHVASGAIKPGTSLREYRALAQELVTNPQAVARAYRDLEWAGVVTTNSAGALEVTDEAAAVCRVRLQQMARQGLRQAVAKALASGLEDVEIQQVVKDRLAALPAAPVDASDTDQAIMKPGHESSHRDSSAIQVLPGQTGPGRSQPQRAAGGDIRPLGG